MFHQPIDWIALALLTAVLPVYHALLPTLRRRGERFTGGRRIRREIESWIRVVITERQPILAVQQMRNLTMVAATLTSATLIIMTLAGSFLLGGSGEVVDGTFVLDPLTSKVLVLLGALAVAFVSFVQALTQIGRFTLLVAADPATIQRGEGDPVRFLGGMLIQAFRTFRTGLHFLTALIAVLFWTFNPWLCIGFTALLAVKFIFFDDFPYLIRRRSRPLRAPHQKP